MAKQISFRARGGFTILECMVALALLLVVAVIITQGITWGLQARMRLAAQHAALEVADNVLEAARAQPWDKLNQAWADAQTIPTESAELLPEGKIVAKVEEGPQPLTRRVAVEVQWQFEPQLPVRKVELTAILAARAAQKSGGKP